MSNSECVDIRGERGAAMFNGIRSEVNRQVKNGESQVSKSKRDGKRTKGNLSDPISSMITSRHRRYPDRGAASDACYVEHWSFKLSTLADVMRAIRESSVVGIRRATSRAT